MHTVEIWPNQVKSGVKILGIKTTTQALLVNYCINIGCYFCTHVIHSIVIGVFVDDILLIDDGDAALIMWSGWEYDIRWGMWGCLNLFDESGISWVGDDYVAAPHNAI